MDGEKGGRWPRCYLPPDPLITEWVLWRDDEAGGCGGSPVIGEVAEGACGRRLDAEQR